MVLVSAMSFSYGVLQMSNNDNACSKTEAEKELSLLRWDNILFSSFEDKMQYDNGDQKWKYVLTMK